MTFFQTVLMLAALLCPVVAGFLFAFAVVVMPGIRSLDDGGFIRAFQVIDRVIQNNQPLFIFVWVVSGLSAVTATMMGMWKLGGVDRQLLAIATLIYVLGVQVSTVIVNVPLNNTLQTLDSASMNEPTRKRARDSFEPRWNRWNVFRTICASFVSILLLVVLVRA